MANEKKPAPAGKKPEGRAAQYRPQRTPRGQRRGRSAVGGVVNTLSYILMILGVSLLISGFCLVVANDVLALVKQDREIVITVPEESSVSDVAFLLEQDGIIAYPWAFRLFASLKNTEELPSGDFTLNPNMDYGQLLSALTAGDNTLDTVTLTIPEGYTLAQIAALFEENRVCTQEDFFETANTYDFAHFMLDDVPLEENRLEGYLFPDTYEFYQVGEAAWNRGETSTNALNAINKMLNNFVSKYSRAMRNLTEESGMTIAEIVNIASLIEREASVAEERMTIAGVIYNRLDSSSYPYLNIDATLLYVLGHREQLTAADLEIDSPYNTYRTEGLPPTAICNPGLACIMAAILPEDHGYYFYVLNPETNTHIFSRTLEEHNRAVAQVNAD